MPVMEGKCALFKEFGDVDAFPICVRSKDVDEIVNAIYLISGSFGGINLEDREIISKSGGFRASKFGKEQNTSFIYELNPSFYNEGFARANLVDYFTKRNAQP